MVNDNLISRSSLVLKNNPPLESDLDNLTSRSILIDGRYICSFCGFHHLKNILDMDQGGNYFIVDPFCYFSLHISLLDDDDAVVVFLPLPREDVNNLQRTIFIALQSKDPLKRQQAKDIHNWLLSHEKYIENYYGTSSFKEWKKVFSLADNTDFSYIHIIYKNFSIFDKYYDSMKLEYTNYPTKKWASLYEINK